MRVSLMRRRQLAALRPCILFGLVLLCILANHSVAEGAAVTTLHTFSGPSPAPFNPAGGPTIVGSKLYGTTTFGGTNGTGTVYSMNLNGSGFLVLDSFSLPNGEAPT